MRVVVVDDDVFLAHERYGHPERPERLIAIREAIARSSDLAALEHREARDATDTEIQRAHTPQLLEELQQLAVAGGGDIDADTYVTATSMHAARRAAGAAIVAVDSALAGDHAFALVRPPGHHATRASAMGFCLLNNVAIAAYHALDECGLQRVAIIDIDVHHGNGTEEIFEDDARVLYTSIHQWPFYPGTGARSDAGVGDGVGTTINYPIAAGATESAWLELFADLRARVAEFDPQLLMVSAGFDALATDPLAGQRLTPSTYGRVAAAIATLAPPTTGTAWCLEGGYDVEAVGEAAVAVLEALTRHDGERA